MLHFWAVHSCQELGDQSLSVPNSKVVGTSSVPMVVVRMMHVWLCWLLQEAAVSFVILTQHWNVPTWRVLSQHREGPRRLIGGGGGWVKSAAAYHWVQHRDLTYDNCSHDKTSCSWYAQCVMDCDSTGAAFSKVPRKILGKLLILGATDTQVATSSGGYSATVEHCTNRPINSVQRSNRKLCSSSSNSSSKIRSYPKIFLGTFENAATEL